MLHREDLDKMVAEGCQFNGCDHSRHGEPFFLHSACHPAAGQRVSYQGGVLQIVCRTCGRRVASVAVGEREV